MKQSFVNINSFTSQKKWKNCYFLFLFNETREKKNRQRKVFKKSLVICNYASKLQQIIQQIQSQTEQHGTRTHTSIFCFCLTALSLPSIFWWEREGEHSCNNQQQVTFMNFSFSCQWKNREEDGFFRGLVSFSLWNFSAFTRCLLTKKSFIPKNVKKENHKKETELYYSMPLCPL